MVQHCVSLESAIVVGSFGEERAPNQHVMKLVTKFLPQIQEKEHVVFTWFAPISYKLQTHHIIAGINYKIKVRYDYGYMILSIFDPLPYFDEQPILMGYEKHWAVLQI